MEIADDAALEIAKRCRKTPRVANRLFKRVRDFALVEGSGKIDLAITVDSLSRLQVDEYGLDQIDIDHDFDAAFDCYMRHYAMREDSYFAIESGHRREHKWPVFHAADYIKQPEKDSYAAVALTFIRSLASGKPVEMVLSVPNEGALPCLAPEDVAELSCTVDADGVHPHRFASIPPMHTVLIQAVKLYENLTVRAILEKDRSLAVQALTVHPLIGSYSLAEQLVEAYSKRYSAYIGGWES